jgi:hypothetical protein
MSISKSLGAVPIIDPIIMVVYGSKIISKKLVKILKSAFFVILPPLMLCQSARECPNFLKICQITNFDTSFQKNNIKSRNKIVDFLNGRFLADPPLNIKKVKTAK